METAYDARIEKYCELVEGDLIVKLEKDEGVDSAKNLKAIGLLSQLSTSIASITKRKMNIFQD